MYIRTWLQLTVMSRTFLLPSFFSTGSFIFNSEVVPACHKVGRVAYYKTIITISSGPQECTGTSSMQFQMFGVRTRTSFFSCTRALSPLLHW